MNNLFYEAQYRSEYYLLRLKREYTREKLRSEWETHRAPPQCISIGGKIFIELLFHQINQERGKDEHKEPDVPGSDQFLLDGEADTEDI